MMMLWLYLTELFYPIECLWEGLDVIETLQISLSVIALLPLVLGWIVIIVGLLVLIVRLSFGPPHPYRDNSNEGQASMFILLHHRPVMKGYPGPGGYQDNNNMVMLSWSQYDKSRYLKPTGRNLVAVAASLSKDGDVKGVCRECRQLIREAPELYAAGVVDLSMGSFRSVVEPDPSLPDRMDYLNFNFTRYSDTPEHLYKERNPIVFKFVPPSNF